MTRLTDRSSSEQLDDLRIEYIFNFPDGERKVFQLNLEDGFNLREDAHEKPPNWTELGFHQCPHCPLSTKKESHCPLAVSLVELIESSVNLRSYEKVEVEIRAKDRQISFHTSIQKGLSSLMGLIIPTSGCPHTSYFKPMARFHLPHANVEETIYRATSMYLLSQYIRKLEGLDASFDLQGLRDIYQNVHVVNTFISRRLRSITNEDASVNAVIILDMFSQLLPMSIEQALEELKPLFHAYLNR
ncbi:hypothetical protein SCOR_33440 [Sulfidibacter corallicola]|uniref:Uncharacterized protein n=1 Tax=Sulfidibacter corallicola TaxID=2818388 RepID=A0A8A4TJ31_SULCO|nr:hypothetical protein [Sulfidibacter corallicola]QTD49560.1 hypothetical protein J3U87_28570 [Sulfidibacter corallicola]